MRLPSLTTFLKALRNFARRPEVVPRDIEELRAGVCDRCEFSEGFQCQKCTCFIPLKIKLSTESCPIQKWGEYHNPKNNGIPT